MDTQRALFRRRMSKIKKVKALIFLLVVVLGITILQDFLQAKYKSHSFYFSESLLFNFFWVLIIPVTFLLRLTFKKSKTFLKIKSKWTVRILFIAVATVLHLLLFAFLVYAVTSLFYEHTFGFLDNVVYSLANDLYKYLLIYTAISLVPMQKSPDPEIQKSGEHPDFFLLHSGKKTEKIPSESILYIASATPYVEFYTSEKKYLEQGSLKSFSEKMDPKVFVRIHKTMLVNIGKVESMSSRGNGDYDLHLSNGKEVRLSRNYVKEFRRIFERASSGG